VSGLAPRQKVTVTSTAVDYERGQWRGQAIFRADGRGVVSLDQARPISGSYQGVDGMGLFWSMNPVLAVRHGNPGFPNGGVAWSDHGKPIRQGTISGPVPAVAGAEDAIWDSSTAAGHNHRRSALGHQEHGRQPCSERRRPRKRLAASTDIARRPGPLTPPDGQASEIRHRR
jgi:hypothetical protein